MTDKLIESVSQILDKEDDVLALFLFGSKAAGTDKKGSDYDFYMILDKTTKDSLREDELSKLIFEATKKSKAEIHLTFQYLFVIDEDKSLMLKISTEGKLLFSKTYLITPYKQLGLQRYFICKWDINTKKLIGKKAIGTNKLLINRLLYGYIQKYIYRGETKESKKDGLIDNKIIFGGGQTVIMPDMMFYHIKSQIENKYGKLQILNTCYIPTTNIKEIEKYCGKKKLETFLRKKKKLPREPTVTYVKPFNSDNLWIKYDSETKHFNTLLKIRELPKEIQDNTITKEKHKFA